MAKETKSKSYIDKLKALGKKIADKFNEEVDQYKSMGTGEYVAHNMTSTQRKLAWAVGEDEAARRIERRGGKLVAQGKKFDSKVQKVKNKIDKVVTECKEVVKNPDKIEEYNKKLDDYETTIVTASIGNDKVAQLKVRPWSRTKPRIDVQLAQNNKEK